MQPTPILAKNLTALAGVINTAHADALTAARSALTHARQAGDLLIEAKDQIPHGQWLPWLAQHCPTISEQQAQRYMRIARRWPELEANPSPVTDLTQREALALLAQPSSTDMADTWQPPAGGFCFIAGARSHSDDVDIWIHPSVNQGYFFVSVLRPNAMGERWAIVDGTKRALLGSSLPLVLSRCFHVDDVDLAAAEWVPDCEGWTYNEVLFRNEAEWRASWTEGSHG